MNPFFVAFLGILGGLLADQVVDRIKRTGQEWLEATGTSKDRWILHKVDDSQDIDRMAQELSGYLSVDKKKVVGYLIGESEIPPHHQIAIAAYLKKDVRELFSDVPPKGHNA